MRARARGSAITDGRTFAGSGGRPPLLGLARRTAAAAAARTAAATARARARARVRLAVAAARTAAAAAAAATAAVDADHLLLLQLGGHLGQRSVLHNRAKTQRGEGGGVKPVATRGHV